jgi:hypothetical protein
MSLARKTTGWVLQAPEQALGWVAPQTDRSPAAREQALALESQAPESVGPSPEESAPRTDHWEPAVLLAPVRELARQAPQPDHSAQVPGSAQEPAETQGLEQAQPAVWQALAPVLEQLVQQTGRPQAPVRETLEA